MTRTLGEQLAIYRRRRSMSQRDVAEAAGISVDTVRQLEQGQRHTARLGTLVKIAGALDQDLAELIGKPRGLVVGAEDGEIAHLRRAVLDLIPAEAEPDAAVLRDELGDAWRLYWVGRYAALARALPANITAARASVRAAADPAAARQAQAVLADFLHLVASLLAHLAHDDLAALAMYQALAAAGHAEDELLVAGMSATRAWMLSRQGLLGEAESLALATARSIEPSMATANVDQVAIWGENLRYACVALARDGRHTEAAELLPRLRLAAARVEAARPARAWTERVTDKSTRPLAGLAFGATLATMTAVAVAGAADRHRQALALEDQVPNFGSVSPSMRSRHLLTVAWAQMADYRSQAAVGTLLRAEKIAPDLFFHQTIARTIVAELLPRRRKQRLPGLVSLAERMGVPAG
ncbi:helix-turn-helix transcriptional regulator [Actinoplanes sp. NPDC051346]|uniref:helix-turn-helix domain-containing protein n=1 Tax=Actinoplanes sp. NPDC051346 TaxID=3155048 RepID=UPI00341C5BD8